MRGEGRCPGVMFVTSYPKDPTGSISGPQRVMRSLVHALRDLGHDIEVWSSPYDHLFRRRKVIDDEGVRVGFVSPWVLIRLVLRSPSSVLHIGSFSLFHIVPLLVRRLLGHVRPIGPIVYTAHGILAVEAREGYRTVPLVTELVERILIRASDRIMVLSHQMADDIVQRFGVPRSKISVIGAAAPEEFLFTEDAWSAKRTEDPVFLYVGGLRPVKALDVMAGAVSRLHEADPRRPWTVHVAGEPYPTLEPPSEWGPLIDRGRIRLLGALSTEELKVAYRKATCLLLPSRWEPYGMVVLEAMALWTPAIVSDRVGAKDLIEEGRSGIVVPYGDDEGLAKAMKWILDDPERARDMGREARRRVIRRTWTDTARLHVEGYGCCPR